MTAAATVSKLPAAARPAAPVKEAARSIAPAGIAPALLRAGLIRAKLKVGAAGDPEEHEADRMADGAMAGGGACCAKCAAGQSCDDTIRMKPAGRSTARDGGSHAAALTASLGGGEPMPARLRAMFEPRYGQDLSHIRLHTDETGAASARAIGARAFALGPNIAFGAGEYQPDTRNGQWLIAHEVAHVVRGHEGVRRRDPDLAMIRGDVKDLRSGRIVNVAHVDEHGVLVARPHGGAQGQATDDLSGPGTHPHADTPSAGQASRNVHAEVAAGVHDQAQSAGTGFRVGPQSHAVGVGGSGTRADFYFCSDRCSSLRGKLEAIVDVLPAGHPEREIFAGLLGKLNGAVKKLRSGKITGAEADGVADAVSDEIRRHGGQSEVFAALMNTDIGDLIAHRAYLRTMFGNRMKSARDQLELQGERQAASRGSARQRGEDGSPADASPLETDLFGGLDMQNVARPGHRPQPLRFDTGNFGHGNAEALVPGLPRGLDKEVHVTFPDGTTGRADRVQFIRDPDGAVVGFRVYEIKPNTADQIAAGHTQAQRYVDALKARIEADLRQAGRPVSSTLADGRPAFGYEVMTYDRNRLRAVLRALRANRSDYGRGVTNAQRAMAEQADEAIARQLFGG